MNDLMVVEKIAQWQKLKALVLDSVSSPITERVYNMALDEFMGWFQQAPRPGFTKATVSAWRVSLEDRGLGSSSIIIRMSAIRKLAAEAALSLYTVTPCRVLDSRLPAGTPPFSTTRDVNVTGSACGLPPTAQAFVFNATVVPPGSLGFITMWPQGQMQPLAATLNDTDGAIANNMVIVQTSTGSVSVFPLAPTHLVLDIFGYFAP